MLKLHVSTPCPEKGATIFTALHGMQTRSSDENSVCLSVRPSVCHTRELWQNGRKICPDFNTIRKNIYLVFWEEEWLVGGDPFYLKFWVNPRWSEIADFQPIIARSSSAVTRSEKSSINANRKSTTRFSMSLRRSSYVAPKSPKGGLKNAKRPISIEKKHFAWRKSATKFLCMKAVSDKVVRHSSA